MSDNSKKYTFFKKDNSSTTSMKTLKDDSDLLNTSTEIVRTHARQIEDEFQGLYGIFTDAKNKGASVIEPPFVPNSYDIL